MEVGAFNPLVLEIGCEGVAAPLDNAVFVGVVFLRAVVLDDIIPAVVLGLVGRAPADLVTPSALLLAKSNQYKEKKEMMSPWGDLNSRPLVYKTSALTAELQRLIHRTINQTAITPLMVAVDFGVTDFPVTCILLLSPVIEEEVCAGEALCK